MNTILEMLIGTLLGDAHIGRSGLNKAFINFEQSKQKIEYIAARYFLHQIIKEAGFILKDLVIYSRIDSRYSNKKNESVYFRTESLAFGGRIKTTS